MDSRTMLRWTYSIYEALAYRVMRIWGCVDFSDRGHRSERVDGRLRTWSRGVGKYHITN